LVIIFIACIGILNLLLVAVFERTREMGVLAALGMKGRQIVALFLLEGTLIGVLGAVIGCALGVALVGALGQVGWDLSFMSGMGEIGALMGDRLYPSITLADILGRGITVAILAAVASLYPGLAVLAQGAGGGAALCLSALRSQCHRVKAGVESGGVPWA
jgi:ABC-type lipoprotein release transport system permease subunit